MLSAAVRRSSQDVKIMKEKLIFSGGMGLVPASAVTPLREELLFIRGSFPAVGQGTGLTLGDTGTAHGGWNGMILKFLSSPNHSVALWPIPNWFRSEH